MPISVFFDPRCESPAQCVPVFDSSQVVTLPVEGTDDVLLVRGTCVLPCATSCASEPRSPQCGRNGLTYYNSCYRECADQLVSKVL